MFYVYCHFSVGFALSKLVCRDHEETGDTTSSLCNYTWSLRPLYCISIKQMCQVKKETSQVYFLERLSVLSLKGNSKPYVLSRIYHILKKPQLKRLVHLNRYEAPCIVLSKSKLESIAPFVIWRSTVNKWFQNFLGLYWIHLWNHVFLSFCLEFFLWIFFHSNKAMFHHAHQKCYNYIICHTHHTK